MDQAERKCQQYSSYYSLHERRSRQDRKSNRRYENRKRKHKHECHHHHRHTRENEGNSWHKKRKEYSRSRRRSKRVVYKYKWCEKKYKEEYPKRKDEQRNRHRKTESKRYKRHDHESRSRSSISKRKLCYPIYSKYSQNKKIHTSSYVSNSLSKKKSSSKSGSNSTNNSEFGHYKYKLGTCIKSKYQITSLLGDGTFGRVLECKNLLDDCLYAVKVIRPVKKYIDSAKIEADIIYDILAKDTDNQSQCVKMMESFTFWEHDKEYMALVFEKLGKSLYEFIKANNYREYQLTTFGYPISHVQSFAKQIFQGIGFLHQNLELTHTDLKPENLLFKYSTFNVIKEKDHWPKQVFAKDAHYRSESPSTRSYSKDVDTEDGYKLPLDTTIKIIDFGGATYIDDNRSGIINTRQYRAPEVILRCCDWDEKSDIWSIACILAELYTGELLFPTHDNEEHLCFIEKLCGPIEDWMVERSGEECRKLFDLHKANPQITGRKINYHEISQKVEDSVQYLETLDDIILEEHKIFKDFLKFLLIIDPNNRPSCAKALEHQFFKTDFGKMKK